MHYDDPCMVARLDNIDFDMGPKKGGAWRA